MDYDGESLLKVDGKKHKAFSNVYLVSMLLAGTTMALAGCVDEKPEASGDGYCENIKSFNNALGNVPSDEEYKKIKEG